MRLTRRGWVVVYVVAGAAAFALGACEPLWDAMPWAVTIAHTADMP